VHKKASSLVFIYNNNLQGEQTIMGTQNKKQLKEVIQNQLANFPNNSESSVLIDNDVTSEDKSLDSHSSSDLNAVELNNVVDEQESQDLVAVNLPNKRKPKTCGYDEDGYLICK
jgi:hypothetical protein